MTRRRQPPEPRRSGRRAAAASLPIGLSVARSRGRLRDSDRVLLAAFGAGMVWGGLLLEWGVPR